MAKINYLVPIGKDAVLTVASVDYTEVEKQLELDKIQTEERIADLQEKSKTINSFLSQFNDEMKLTHSDLVEELAQLKQELRELEQRSYGTKVADDLFQQRLFDDADFREAYERTKQHNEVLSAKAKKTKKSSGSKRLFKLIAAKAHPDKTAEIWLQEIFILARQAYEHDEYEELKLLYNCICLGVTWKVQKLKLELFELQTQEAYLVLNLNNTCSSDLFMLANSYQHPANKAHVDLKYRNMLEAEVMHVINSIRVLDKSRYTDRQSKPRTINGWTFNTLGVTTGRF